MKKGIHPENYRLVVFKDMSNGDTFLTCSVAPSKETIEFEGATYPVIKIDISNNFTIFVDQFGGCWDFVTPYDFIKDEPIFTI